MILEDFALIVGFTLLGIGATWLATWYHYRKALRKGELDREVLESLIGSDIRVRDDKEQSGIKRGTIFKTADGKYAVRWGVVLDENLAVGDTVKAEVPKAEKDD